MFPIYKGCLGPETFPTDLPLLQYTAIAYENHGLTNFADVAPRDSLFCFLYHLMAVVHNSPHRILPSHLERFDLRSRERLDLSSHRERFHLHGLR